jgi:two-component system, NtrC family, sensor histidine kinase PilS
VLNISRAKVASPEQHGSSLLLDDALQRITSDWAAQADATQVLKWQPGAPNVSVVFDPEHLRRLMINLLDNALRYASNCGDSIVVWSRALEAGSAQLAVWSDGQPLEKTVQTHLFEPFFSSESRSSGLGLYICRELCERYGGSVGYRRTPYGNKEGNEFFVVLKSANLQQIHRENNAQTVLVTASA